MRTSWAFHQPVRVTSLALRVRPLLPGDDLNRHVCLHLAGVTPASRQAPPAWRPCSGEARYGACMRRASYHCRAAGTAGPSGRAMHLCSDFSTYSGTVTLPHIITQRLQTNANHPSQMSCRLVDPPLNATCRTPGTDRSDMLTGWLPGSQSTPRQ